jgi:hypothetical protein
VNKEIIGFIYIKIVFNFTAMSCLQQVKNIPYLKSRGYYSVFKFYTYYVPSGTVNQIDYFK